MSVNSSQESSYKQILRIVLASPDDVKKERAIVKQVVDDLNLNLGRHFGIALELQRWEDIPPGLHEGGPQAQIDAYLDMAQADVVIGVFWKKFGTPTASGETPTEHEIRKAHELWGASRRPQVMLYFNGEGPTSPRLEELHQWGRVIAFRAEFLSKGVVCDYVGTDDFAIKTRNHLTNIVSQTAAARMTPESIPCSVSVLPKLMRSEGVTELVGEVRLSLPRRPDLTEIEVNIHIVLNTNITNAIGSSMRAIEPLLIIERSSEDTHDYEAVFGKMMGVNHLVFSSVKIPLRGSGGLRTLRLLGLRANAFQLGNGSQMFLFVRMENLAGPDISVLNPQVMVGLRYPGFSFGNTTTWFDRKDGVNTQFAMGRSSKLESNFHCTFRENFPDAFRNRTQESVAGAYPGLVPESPTCERGTLLRIRFENVPSEILVYATESEIGCGANPLARLVPGSIDDNGREARSDDGTMKLLPKLAGVVNAVWEWVSTDPRSPLTVDTVRFGFAIVADPGKAGVGQVILRGHLAPTSIQITSSSMADIPRFGDSSSPRNAFFCNP